MTKPDQGSLCSQDALSSRQDDDFSGSSGSTPQGLGFALVEAGADTTSVYFQFFILMMTAFPEVRKRAQQEIDDVIGPNRLPMLEDFENLPYVNAVVNEVRLSRSEISF